MDFEPQYFVDLLARKGATHLYHANTVTTSCSMLRMGALSSRGEVESVREPQTFQGSDQLDREHNIWDCVFVDTSDIHRVVSATNRYGPVLFVFNPSLLLQAPESSIRVTRLNPTNWNGLPDERRWFTSAEALEAEYNPADIGQMIVIRSPGRRLSFNPGLERVVVDNPRARVQGEDGLELAVRSLNEAAAISSVALPHIQTRACMPGCGCESTYRDGYGLLYRNYLPRMGG